MSLKPQHVVFFYTNYIRGFLKSDHSHARYVLKVIKDDFKNNINISNRLIDIDKRTKEYRQGKLYQSDEITEVSEMIAKTVPCHYKAYVHGNEYLDSIQWRYKIGKYKKGGVVESGEVKQARNWYEEYQYNKKQKS